MKSLDEIQDEWAQQQGFLDWYDLTVGNSDISERDVKGVALLYGKYLLNNPN